MQDEFETLDEEFTKEKAELKELDEKLGVSIHGQGEGFTYQSKCPVYHSFGVVHLSVLHMHTPTRVFFFPSLFLPPPPSLHPQILTIEYDAVIKEQEEARQRAEEAQRQLAIAVGAARIIQKVWRRYRQKKMELKSAQKKGKKGKGKGKGKGKKKK